MIGAINLFKFEGWQNSSLNLKFIILGECMGKIYIYIFFKYIVCEA